MWEGIVVSSCCNCGKKMEDYILDLVMKVERESNVSGLNVWVFKLFFNDIFFLLKEKEEVWDRGLC